MQYISQFDPKSQSHITFSFFVARTIVAIFLRPNEWKMASPTLNFKSKTEGVNLGIERRRYRGRPHTEETQFRFMGSQRNRLLETAPEGYLESPPRATSISPIFVFLLAVLSFPATTAFRLPAHQSRPSLSSRATIPSLLLNLDVPESTLNEDVLIDTKSQAPNTESERPLNGQVPSISNQTNINEYFSNPGDGSAPVCRVVSLADGKLPTSPSVLPAQLFQPPYLLRKLDDVYHAMAHDETRRLKYMEPESSLTNVSEHNSTEEEELVSVLKTSLEDAGFELLGRRDLELCDALNAGYLLRLSILPDTSELDPIIARDFYPERLETSFEAEEGQQEPEELLFDGRVLIFWRGYSKEISRGRLLLPKIDYLQASLVQRSAAWVKGRLDVLERYVAVNTVLGYRKAASAVVFSLKYAIQRIPSERISKTLLERLGERSSNNSVGMGSATKTQGNIFKLSRYGGSKTRFVGSPNPMDQLTPFVICEEAFDDGSSTKELLERVDRTMYDCLNRGEIMCPFDAKLNRTSGEEAPTMQLLERVTISNLIDLFSQDGRGKLLKTIISKSQLVEPTYKEVVVVWRPLPKEPKQPKQPKFPSFLYDLADMFDIEGLPEIPSPLPKPTPAQIQIRAFSGVPMANLLAIMPKTKLVFRPADAFVFDLVSIFSFLVIFGSLKFDNPRLDLLALVSVSLWAIRTVLRYSNKLARYDLLVKKFLTRLITHRNAGALKYIATEAGSQRATRAALVYSWLSRLGKNSSDTHYSRAQLIEEGKEAVNELIRQDRNIPVDIDASLNDLEDLRLVSRRDDGGVDVVQNESELDLSLQSVWNDVFSGELTLKALVGRRKRT
jgi:hypothetical protein